MIITLSLNLHLKAYAKRHMSLTTDTERLMVLRVAAQGTGVESMSSTLASAPGLSLANTPMSHSMVCASRRRRLK